MGFFEHQRLSRRNTRVMVVLFLIAVVIIAAAVDAVFTAAAVFMFELDARQSLVWGGVAAAAVILIVSLVEMGKLAGGGEAVAKMLGARRLAPGTGEPLERRLLNVVEEMAIAAGVRVPAVYVLDNERGLNAFAAGWDVSNAAITVTRGTLDTLNRDELQGVIGHEFSHIVNGDVRLNVRMIGVLGGIVFIGSIGQFIMRGAREADDIRGFLALFTFGLVVFLIGYIGLFFARLIKSAVSRQREFLADASSVQFTRNPDGIAGALDQMRVVPAGSLMRGRYAEELSHMYFGQGVKIWLHGLFDTHPPIDERIRRVHPRFERSGYRQRRPVAARADADVTAVPGAAAGFAGGPAAPAGRRGADLGVQWGRSAEQSAALVGSLDGGKVDYAARLLSSLPADLRAMLREPQGASGAMLALLLAPNEQALAQQIEALKAAGLGTLADRALPAYAYTRTLGLAYHLPVIDLGLATVKSAPEQMKQELAAALEAAANADRRVSLHEFVVVTLVRDQLAPRKKLAENKKISDLKAEAATLLALIAYAGTRADATGARQQAVQAAMQAGAKIMGISAEAPAAAALTLDAARAALEGLKSLAPMQKAILVKGLFATVSADGTIRVSEAGLMRLVGAVLDCPLPPLFAEIDPAKLAA